MRAQPSSPPAVPRVWILRQGLHKLSSEIALQKGLATAYRLGLFTFKMNTTCRNRRPPAYN
jgi:hypothetical protein